MSCLKGVFRQKLPFSPAPHEKGGSHIACSFRGQRPPGALRGAVPPGALPGAFSVRGKKGEWSRSCLGCPLTGPLLFTWSHREWLRNHVTTRSSLYSHTGQPPVRCGFTPGCGPQDSRASVLPSNGDSRQLGGCHPSQTGCAEQLHCTDLQALT